MTFKTIFFLFILPFGAFAQESKMDSLWKIIDSPQAANIPFTELKKIQKEYIQLTSNNPAKRVEQLTRASLFLLQENPDTSLILSNEAEKIAESSGNDVLKAMAYVSKSAVYSVKDEVDNIWEYAMKAYVISEKTPLDPDIMSSIYRKFGRVYRDQKNTTASAEAYKKALAFSMKSNHLKDISGTAGTLGQIYGIMKQYDTAVIYLKQALELSKKNGFNDNVTRGYIHILDIYDEMNDIANATGTLNQLEYWLKTKDVSPVIKSLAYTSIADFDLRKGNTNRQKAAQYLDSMKVLLNTTQPGTENLMYYYLNRSLLEFSRQNFSEGSAALIKFHEYKSVFDREFLEGHAQELAAKYETGKKDALIQNLSTERELQKKEKELSDFQKQVAIILAVLLGVLALLFYNRFRLKKKATEALAIKNIEIEKQKELIQNSLLEKETLLREIHHRVKNNLQIISSLLNIQSDNINDPSVLSSIREGQSRVQAMSLIHQNLYQSEHLSNVDIANYLQQLVVYLSEMFLKEGKNITVEVDAENINFDIDTAIPLGLIVNELVSNAYKYAFEKQDSGKIKIGIKALNDVDYELHVDDDGKGLPPDFNPTKSKSLGLKLVNILSRQLRGKFSTHTSDGTSFVVIFKDLRAFQAN